MHGIADNGNHTIWILIPLSLPSYELLISRNGKKAEVTLLGKHFLALPKKKMTSEKLKKKLSRGYFHESVGLE